MTLPLSLAAKRLRLTDSALLHVHPLWQLILGVTTCLILPLQEGGISRPWSDKSVIAELCVFGVLLVLFVAWEWRKGAKAILPMFLFRRRTMVGACIVSFFL